MYTGTAKMYIKTASVLGKQAEDRPESVRARGLLTEAGVLRESARARGLLTEQEGLQEIGIQGDPMETGTKEAETEMNVPGR